MEDKSGIEKGKRRGKLGEGGDVGSETSSARRCGNPRSLAGWLSVLKNEFKLNDAPTREGAPCAGNFRGKLYEMRAHFLPDLARRSIYVFFFSRRRKRKNHSEPGPELRSL